MTDEELGEKLYEAYRKGMRDAGVEVQEEWDELEPADQEGWAHVALVARQELG